MSEPKSSYSHTFNKSDCREAVKDAIDDSVLEKRLHIRLGELVRTQYNIEYSVKSILFWIRAVFIILAGAFLIGLALI